MNFCFTIVRHCWSCRYLHPGRFPQLDQKETRLSWATCAHCLRCLLFLWSSQSHTRWHLLLPADRPLCRVGVYYVSRIFPDDCNWLDLRCSKIVEEHQADDGQESVVVLPFLLANCGPFVIDRRLKLYWFL